MNPKNEVLSVKKQKTRLLLLVLVLVSMASGAFAAEMVILNAAESSIPGGYTQAMEDTALQGRVERVDYQTQDYVNGGGITKAVFVYLPAGYDDPVNAEKQYDILYFMHGYSGTAYELFGFHNGANKNILDHMIANGEIRPIIVVAATWNISPDTPTDNQVVWPGTGSGTAQREAF